ncbi:uncharacterized protein LOC124185571 [Neodiprion fabricii]|uniref:uncharacterized protein LOC124185571 n=1 Tax=Neodiprion fabricii TaxID=2872261 RepID=UPI001ED970AB|nr:uncharacterized protein LOC124185571 [Neodiprion fabricii]
MPGAETTRSSESLDTAAISRKSRSYWSHMVSHYEKRKASLEQRQTELAERIHLMECAVPSLLMGAMVSIKRNVDPSPRLLQTGFRPSEQPSTSAGSANPEGRDAPNCGSNESTGLRRVNARPEPGRFCKNTDFRP